MGKGLVPQLPLTYLCTHTHSCTHTYTHTCMHMPSLLAPSHPRSPGTRLLAPAPTLFVPSSPRHQFRVPGWSQCWGPQRRAAGASGTSSSTSLAQAGLPGRRITGQPHSDAHPGPLPSLGQTGGSPGQEQAALPELGSSPVPLGEGARQLSPQQRFTSTHGINIFVSGWARGPMWMVEGRQQGGGGCSGPGTERPRWERGWRTRPWGGGLPPAEARHNWRKGEQRGSSFALGLGRIRCQGSESGAHIPPGITASSGQPGGGAARSLQPRWAARSAGGG